MGRLAAVLGLVLVGACGTDPPGLTLEIVTGDPAIKSVELFMGKDCGGMCGGAIAPPTMARMDAEGFLTDDTARWFAVVKDGLAGFRIDGNTTLPILVAVGLDASDQPIATATLRDVAIATDATYARLRLTSAAPIVEGARAPEDGSERVTLWRSKTRDTLPRCVVVEHWRGGAPVREFVVPADDTDCDDAPNECDAFAAGVAVGPTIDTATCLIPGGGSSGNVTLIGGPICNEGPVQSQACLPLDENYCVADELATCAPWAVDCLNNVIAQDIGLMPSIVCTIPLKLDGTSCVGSSTRIPFAANELRYGSTETCKTIGMHDIAAPGRFVDALKIDQGELRFENVQSNCAGEVTWSGAYTLPEHSVVMLAALELETNGNRLVVPFSVSLDRGTCGTGQRTCSVYAGVYAATTLYKCASARPAPSCEPSGACTGAPQCGASCCNDGEACVNGQCSCGLNAACDAGQTCAAGGATDPNFPCGTVCCGNGSPCPL